MFEKSILICCAAITMYFVGVACTKPLFGVKVFCPRTFLVIAGCILGSLIATPFYSINDIAGYIVLGTIIATLLGLYYGGFYKWLWKRIPDKLKKRLRLIGKIILTIGLILVIIGIIVGILYFYFNTN